MSTADEKPAEPGNTTPAPASVTLPSTFHNSFWSTDYRTGFESVYGQLHVSINQSNELLSTVRRRAHAEMSFAMALTPPALKEDGFGASEGGSMRVGFEALLTSQFAEARARRVLAEDLERNIAGPFAEWSKAHQGRIASSQNLIETHLSTWEKSHSHVHKLKIQYDDACRAADEAEDELAHFKASPSTTSPKLASPTLEEKGKGRAKPFQEDDEKSIDGIDTIEDDDDVPLGRATISALARRFTTVRKQATQTISANLGSTTTTGADDQNSLDPNVGAAMDWGKATFSSLLERVAGPQTGELRTEKARKYAEEIEKRYRDAVFALDNQRLILEEVLAEHLTYAQRCETDRIKAASSVLRSFHIAVAALPKLISGSLERVSSTLELLRPEQDVKAIIERAKTGPFQPKPVTFHCHYSEPPTEIFGIDLRKYDETRRARDPIVPPVLTFLLDYIKKASSSLSDVEKRKMWLYETPLSLQHRLRALLQSSPLTPSLLSKFDLPVIASTVKLWLLELEIPPIVYTQYDELKHLYPKRVGSEIVEIPAKLLAEHLARLPSIHLEVLRSTILYFAKTIEDTKTEETDEIYLQKLSLSLARCLLRPRVETSLSIDDRFPALLFTDLVKSHEIIFSSADELKGLKERDGSRCKPRRQRTKLVDSRLSRSSIGKADDESVGVEEGLGLLKKQHHEREGSPEAQNEKEPVSRQGLKDEPATAMTEEPKEVEERVAKVEFEWPKNDDEEREDEYLSATEEEQITPTATRSKPLPEESEDQPLAKANPSLSRSTRTKGGRSATRPLSTASTGSSGVSRE